jgi:hypothetical protein
VDYFQFDANSYCEVQRLGCTRCLDLQQFVHRDVRGTQAVVFAPGAND